MGSSCTEIVHKNEATLYGNAPGDTTINRQHPAGRQSYRFNFLLPAELPSSTAEGGGLIKYCLTGKFL